MPAVPFCNIIRYICDRIDEQCAVCIITGVVDREIKTFAPCGFDECTECGGMTDRVVCSDVLCRDIQSLALKEHRITLPDAECVQVSGV